MGKYDNNEIVGWYTRGGRHIPIRKKGQTQSDDPKVKEIDPKIIKKLDKDFEAIEKVKKTKAYKDTIGALAHKGFTDDEKHDIAYHVALIKSKKERDMWIDAFKGAQYAFDVSRVNGETCFFRPANDMIHLYREHDNPVRTIFHETAHRLDRHVTLVCEYDGEEKDVEPAVMLDLMVDHAEVYDELAEVMDYDTNENGDIIGGKRNKELFKIWAEEVKAKVGADSVSAISDISSGITQNKLGERAYGYHKTSYWKQMPWLSDNASYYSWEFGFPTMLSRELIAHYFSLMAVDRNAIKIIKETYPTLYEAMEEIYEQVCE